MTTTITPDPTRSVLVSGRHRLSEDALVRCINALPGVTASAYQVAERSADADPDIVLLEAESEAASAEQTARISMRFPRALIVLTGPSAGRVLPPPTSPQSGNSPDWLQALLLGSASVPAVGPARGSSRSTEAESLGRLTARQADVLRLLASGRRPAEIAQVLSISPQTVRTHLQNMMSTLGVHCRLEIVAAARRSGFLDGPRYLAAG